MGELMPSDQTKISRCFCFFFHGYSEGIQFLIPNYSSQLLFHVISTPLQLPRLVKVSTSSEFYSDQFIIFYFRPISPFINTVKLSFAN